MRYANLLVGALLFVSVCGWAQTSSATKRDGNRLLENCGALVRHVDDDFNVATATNTYGSSWCIGYLTGYVEGFDAMAMATGKTYADYLKMKNADIRFPEGNTLGQNARVLVKFLNDHPERLHEDEGLLVFAAFMNAFPCESKPKPTAK